MYFSKKYSFLYIYMEIRENDLLKNFYIDNSFKKQQSYQDYWTKDDVEILTLHNKLNNVHIVNYNRYNIYNHIKQLSVCFHSDYKISIIDNDLISLFNHNFLFTSHKPTKESIDESYNNRKIILNL